MEGNCVLNRGSCAELSWSFGAAVRACLDMLGIFRVPYYEQAKLVLFFGGMSSILGVVMCDPT